MSYLDLLKAEFSGNALPDLLTKPTKAPSVGSVSIPSRLIPQIEGLDNVVQLRLTLRMEDGELCEAVLQIPKERYDGMLVLDLFERYLAGGGTHVMRIEEV